MVCITGSWDGEEGAAEVGEDGFWSPSSLQILCENERVQRLSLCLDLQDSTPDGPPDN